MDLINIISVWLLPLLFAITFHEAAHAYVARFLGDAGIIEKTPVRETPVKSRPKARAQEMAKAAREAAGAAAGRS